MTSQKFFTERRKVVLAVLATLFLWATAFAAIRVGLHDYAPAQLAFVRFIIASFVLGLLAFRASVRLHNRRDLVFFFLSGLFGVAIYHLGLNIGEQTVNAGTASFLVNTAPIFTAILATFALKEEIRPLGWCGIILSFLGVSFISFGRPEGLEFQPGTFLILISALAVSFYAVIQKKFLSKYTAFQFTAISIWCGTAILFLFSGGSLTALRSASFESTAAVLWLGVGPGALAYLTWAYALTKMPANRVLSYMYFLPPLATLVAWIWLGEIPSMIALIGGLIVILGIYLLHRSKKKVLVRDLPT